MAYKHVLNFWPLVPALDIEAVYKNLKVTSEDSNDFNEILNLDQSEHPPKKSFPTEINVLIIGDGTGCLIKTLSKMYSHESKTLNIYVVSAFAETLSRLMLLLSIFNESSQTMGTLEKAEIFLEIFGNTLVRASTAEYIETKSATILEDIVSPILPLQSVPMVSLEFLKQRDIDEICRVMMFLKNSVCKYDVSKAWENALRAYYGTRYDNRRSIFDYLYNMKLSQYPFIGLQKYMDWCANGTAFKLRKGRYDHPNKTLCLNSAFSSSKQDMYCGDIATSPYIAFGVESSNEKLFEKVNNQYTFISEDISKLNIIEYLTEYSSDGFEKEKNVNVYLFRLASFSKTRKFKEFFDAIYLTCDMTSFAANGSVGNLLKTDGIAIFETVKNVVNSTKEQKLKNLEEIDRLARINNLKCVEKLKNDNDDGCFKMFVM